MRFQVDGRHRTTPTVAAALRLAKPPAVRRPAARRLAKLQAARWLVARRSTKLQTATHQTTPQYQGEQRPAARLVAARLVAAR